MGKEGAQKNKIVLLVTFYDRRTVLLGELQRLLGAFHPLTARIMKTAATNANDIQIKMTIPAATQFVGFPF